MGPVLLAEEAILEEIIRTYTAGRLGYRDAMLRVGKLIGDYVRAVLLSSVGLNIQERIDQEKTRAKAILADVERAVLAIPAVRPGLRLIGLRLARGSVRRTTKNWMLGQLEFRTLTVMED